MIVHRGTIEKALLLLMADLGPGTGTGAIRLLPITDEGFYIDAIKAIKRERKRNKREMLNMG